MLRCVCSVIEHRGRQNVVRTSVTHSAAPRVPLFCSYHILTAYCSLRNEMGRNEMERNEMGRNEMEICSLRNGNL